MGVLKQRFSPSRHRRQSTSFLLFSSAFTLYWACIQVLEQENTKQKYIILVQYLPSLVSRLRSPQLALYNTASNRYRTPWQAVAYLDANFRR